ncbi:MAG: hypothetical protein HYZ25_18180 [Chloroflexi bacterium]|nr:hypothetical protein [Chloroflexota bacterium]
MEMPTPKSSRTENRRREKGQVLIIVVFAIIGLVAFIGLVVDLGLVYIGYGNLRRSVDAAALAASLQYREGYTIAGLEAAATEFLTLNGIYDPHATVVTCEEQPMLCDTNGDGTVSDTEHRKFVQVIASTEVQLAFLRVVGITQVPLSAEAVSEAASVDVVLVIDRSESMTNDAPAGDARDPSKCNVNPPPYSGGGGFSGSCDPFTDVKRAADAFIDQLFFPYDRVAVVTFDRDVHCSTCSNAGDRLSLALTSDEHDIRTRIRNLWVFQAGNDVNPDTGNAGIAGWSCEDITGFLDGTMDHPPAGPCRQYDMATENFLYFNCPSAMLPGGSYESCTSTNIGGGLAAAANEFADSMREEALWVTILLTDGAANSSTDSSGNLPFGFCSGGLGTTQPYCRDREVQSPAGSGNYLQTRHCYSILNAGGDPIMDNHAMCMGVTDSAWDIPGIADDGSHYDADDYARDMADWLSMNNVLTFSIGLGNLVTNSNPGDPRDGEQLLKYTAGVTGGLYYYAPTGDQLRAIFAKIADNIATRLTR